MTEALSERDYPKTIWVERDEETNEKRWFTVKGMGVEYVRADLARTSEPASPGAAMLDVSAPGDADRRD